MSFEVEDKQETAEDDQNKDDKNVDRLFLNQLWKTVKN